MERRSFGKFLRSDMIVCAVACSLISFAGAAELPRALAPEQAAAPASVAQVDVRAGGVVQESFAYHRASYGGLHPHSSYAPHTTIAPSGGWYGYGFPVQTYRWGWFGANRYYPRVVWHRGYYDDCCRWAYRHGY